MELTATVTWHDLECGGYRADLPLWRELACDESMAVLDLGAGSGRVTLDLAEAGHRLTAVDLDPELLSALRERARERGLQVEAVQGDAREFSLPQRDFDLCLVPMQTLQLLHGAGEREALFARAHEHLRRGALLACAIVSEVEDFDSLAGALGPSPDRVRHGSTLYMSRPVRVSHVGDLLRIERERLELPDDREPPRPAELNVVELELVEEERLHDELRAAGFTPEPSRLIPETDEHASSEVVIARA